MSEGKAHQVEIEEDAKFDQLHVLLLHVQNLINQGLQAHVTDAQKGLFCFFSVVFLF
jgi:hypothetical protein